MTKRSFPDDMQTAHLAFDLGAGSGRAILGVLANGTLEILEVHRFEHAPLQKQVGLVWDLKLIWRNLLEGLSRAGELCAARELQLTSVGVDTWGVDWCLVDREDELIEGPFCYRDPIHRRYCSEAISALGGFERIYRRTGIQRLPFNTIYQLHGRNRQNPELFSRAKRLLFVPDLLHLLLSGVAATEETIASTSGLLNVETRDWDYQLIDELGLGRDLFQPLVSSGTVLGPLRESVAKMTNIEDEVQVIVPAAHDTASALVATPATNSGNWAYLSSGTWSLLGTERQSPLANSEAASGSFTNELGVEGTTRFLRNISGLWLLQELRRALQAEGQEFSFPELVDMAQRYEGEVPTFDPNHASLTDEKCMKEKVAAVIREGGRRPPDSLGGLVRSCLQSLADDYRATVDVLESITGESIDVVHVVGGGCQNELLKQLTAEALDRRTTFGPVEATAVGNILVQAKGLGLIKSYTEARDVVARSLPIEVLQPRASVSKHPSSPVAKAN